MTTNSISSYGVNLSLKPKTLRQKREKKIARNFFTKKLATQKFPFTRKLMRPHYLITGAILARLAVGAARIYEDRPSNYPASSTMSNYDKSAGLIERIFTETIGTGTYIITIPLMSDFLSKRIESEEGKIHAHLNKTLIQSLATQNNKIKKLSKSTQVILEKYLNEVFDNNLKKNFVVRHVDGSSLEINNFSETAKNINNKTEDVFSSLLQIIKQKEKSEHESAIKELQHIFSTGKNKQHLFHHFSAARRIRLSYLSSAILAASAITAGILAGSPIQYLNDNLIRKKIAPWINAKLGIVNDNKRFEENAVFDVISNYHPNNTFAVPLSDPNYNLPEAQRRFSL